MIVGTVSNLTAESFSASTYLGESVEALDREIARVDSHAARWAHKAAELRKRKAVALELRRTGTVVRP